MNNGNKGGLATDSFGLLPNRNCNYVWYSGMSPKFRRLPFVLYRAWVWQKRGCEFVPTFTKYKKKGFIHAFTQGPVILIAILAKVLSGGLVSNLYSLV
jgi:hypothetical protein